MVNLNGEFLDHGELEGLGLAKLGQGVRLHRSVILINCGAISLGNFVRIDAFSIISAGCDVKIGRNVHVGAHSILVGAANITLGDFSGLSHGVKIYSSSDDYSGVAMTNPTVPEEYRMTHNAPVSVGRHAIVGSGSVILPGCEIGEGCAVGALSLVNRPLEPWNIYAGTPARKVGPRDRNILELEAQLLGGSKR